MNGALDLVIGQAVDVASWTLILAGCFFLLVGGLGVNVFPSFYVRIHAAGVTDSLGATSILLALMLQAGWSLLFLKLLMVTAFLVITSPAASHALVKAAFARGVRIDLPIPPEATVPDPNHRPEE